MLGAVLLQLVQGIRYRTFLEQYLLSTSHDTDRDKRLGCLEYFFNQAKVLKVVVNSWAT